MSADSLPDRHDKTREIIDGLRTVYDPCCEEKGISVVDMGLIESIALDENEAKVELVLTSGWCPFAVKLIDAITEKISRVCPTADVSVQVAWEKGWGSERLSQQARSKLRFLPEPGSVSDREQYVAEHLGGGS